MSNDGEIYLKFNIDITITDKQLRKIQEYFIKKSGGLYQNYVDGNWLLREYIMIKFLGELKKN